MDTQITVALIGAAGVCGTIAGTLVGARIQANGGLAQAQGARDAAEMTAQAMRAQSLSERRWTVLTAYLRAADLCADACSLSFTSGSLEGNEDSFKIFALLQAEAELVAPASLDNHLGLAYQALRNLWTTADIWAPHKWGWQTLEELEQAGSADAVAVLERLRQPARGSRTFAQLAAESQALRDMLVALPGFDRERADGLMRASGDPGRSDRERRHREEYYGEMRQALLEAAREVLGTNHP
ncbi:hypothetical protein [Streptomyces goshikiensis]|uniref:hypothetical protein n=1 Tax=Streptomyces goshikiensis TaxID=1942 RepID=UPI00369E339C